MEVLTIQEALHLSRATVEGQTVVIVATIQSFRVEDTTGRKVYEQNGAFSEHLLNLPADRLADLFPGADGKPNPSLVNMLRLRRPIVIVDEAHNARTPLSFSTLGNVFPSCIVEFTATPSREGPSPSNVLHHVSTAELKAAAMVKLPLRVITRHPSQRDQLLAEAITLRSDFERLAVAEGQMTGEYLRPILLIQAERVDTCEPLRNRLVSEFGIEKDWIKISVGPLDELPAADEIKSPKCPVRVIITVQKLREGWDCPFAYVLCSLKETRSARAIEQIVGRILRLPGAQEKRYPDLNCAYAFSVSDSIVEVLAELRDALESNGFTTEEFRCAQFIDQLPEVKFWVRNLPRKAASFRLLTSKDWFYPDFLCHLIDGRVLAVEYKGKDLYETADAEEKRAVGAVWASRSGGRCLFIMPTEGDFSEIKKVVRPL